MAQLFLHEELYRGRDAIERLGRVKLIVCGAGALGSLSFTQPVSSV